LVAWIKANPAQGNYGTPSAGTLPHFFGIQFGRLAGLDLRHVGYRGSAAAMADFISGQLPILITSTSDLAENHRAGIVRILATTDRQRSPIVSGLPTFKEAGFDIEGRGWYAFYAPARTPAATVEKIAKAIADIVQSPEINQRLLKMGQMATGTTPAQLAAIQKADLEYWGPIIKSSGYRYEE
jgi:tripartite-type tricarboxylate transporter receptor subunit TctC